jgi:hypothetical protein
LISWSYDRYFIELEPEDPKNPQPSVEDWEADERSDTVTEDTSDEQSLTFACENPILPGVTFHKQYSTGAIEGERRALDKMISATGELPRKTLLHLVMRTRNAPAIRPENWEMLFTYYLADDNNKDRRSCSVIPPGTFEDRISIPVPDLMSERTRMITVTQVPAVFFSMEGQRLNLLLPDTLGSTIRGPNNQANGGYQLHVSAAYPSQILVYRPNSRGSVIVNGREVNPELTNYAGRGFAKVDVPEGESVVIVTVHRNLPHQLTEINSTVWAISSSVLM